MIPVTVCTEYSADCFEDLLGSFKEIANRFYPLSNEEKWPLQELRINITWTALGTHFLTPAKCNKDITNLWNTTAFEVEKIMFSIVIRGVNKSANCLL